jgi:GntR family transcriptional regulator
VIIHLRSDGPLPPYAQVRDQIATMVRSGVLVPGTRLPAIRHLANDLGVAPNTIARAYRELEQEGLVASRGRHGTTVLAPAAEPELQAEEVAEAAAQFALEASHRGLDLDRALEAVRGAFGALDERRRFS